MGRLLAAGLLVTAAGCTSFVGTEEGATESGSTGSQTGTTSLSDTLSTTGPTTTTVASSSTNGSTGLPTATGTTMSDTSGTQETLDPSTTDPTDPATGTTAAESTTTSESSATTSGDPSTGEPGCENEDMEPDGENSEPIDNQTCDGAAPVAFDGVLEPGDTIDWYGFVADWPWDGSVGCGAPDPQLVASAPGTRVCIYANCASGDQVIDCGDTPVDPPNGYSGCCADDSVQISVDCVSDENETHAVLVSVERIDDGNCFDYAGTVDVF